MYLLKVFSRSMFLILPPVDPPIGYLGMLVGLLFIFGALEQLQVLTLATDPFYCIHTISNCNIHERHQPTPQTPVRSRLSPRKPWWMWRWIWVCHRCFMKGRLGPVRSAEGNWEPMSSRRKSCSVVLCFCQVWNVGRTWDSLARQPSKEHALSVGLGRSGLVHPPPWEIRWGKIDHQVFRWWVSLRC